MSKILCEGAQKGDFGGEIYISQLHEEHTNEEALTQLNLGLFNREAARKITTPQRFKIQKEKDLKRN